MMIQDKNMTTGNRDLFWEFVGLDFEKPGNVLDQGVFRHSATQGGISQLYIHHCRFRGANVWNSTYTNQGSGHYTTSGFMHNLRVEDCIFVDLFKGWAGDFKNLTMKRNYFVRIASDVWKLGATQGWVLEDQICIDKRKPIGVGSHPDYLQRIGYGLPMAVNDGGYNIRFMVVAGNDIANSDGQGDFDDDQNIDKAWDEYRVENAFMLIKMSNGISVENADQTPGAIVRRNTCLGDGPSIQTNPNVSINLQGCDNTECTDNVVSGSAGHGSLTEEVNPNRTGYTGRTKPDGSNHDFARNTTLGFNSATTLEQLQAAYEAMFYNPQYGSAYQPDPDQLPILSELEAIKAQVMSDYSPIEGKAVADGGLMNPDGTYRGTFFPRDTDGTVRYNDGSVFVKI